MAVQPDVPKVEVLSFRAVPGYDVWPGDLAFTDARYRIMAFGGSTGDRVLGGNWPMHLARLIKETADAPSLVMSGGCGAYNSNSEMLKFWRDSPALMPQIAISFSGINDIDFVHGDPEHPSLHRQQVLMAHALAATKAVGSYLLGLPYTVSSADNWLRNMRTRDEEGPGLVQHIKAGKVDVATIHDVDGSGFRQGSRA